MTLGKIIKQYAEDKHISLRAFSRETGLSSTYISSLTRDKSSSGENPAPSIDTFKVCAKAMGLTLDELVRMTEAGDTEIPHFSDTKKQLLEEINQSTEEELNLTLKILRALRK